jgi:hypothetical protein
VPTWRVTSLHQSYLPSSWVMYRPTIIEVGTLIGSFGLFFTCFLLFILFLVAARALARVPLVPLNDPFLRASLAHRQ